MTRNKSGYDWSIEDVPDHPVPPPADQRTPVPSTPALAVLSAFAGATTTAPSPNLGLRTPPEGCCSLCHRALRRAEDQQNIGLCIDCYDGISRVIPIGLYLKSQLTDVERNAQQVKLLLEHKQDRPKRRF